MIGACEPLSHIPLHPPRSREEFPAEHAYLDTWHELVRGSIDTDGCDDDEALAGAIGHILHDMPVSLTDRHSRLAANFMKWLGTNVGGSLIHDAKLGGKMPGFGDHVLVKWLKHNHRRSFMGRGWRPSDRLTSPDWSNPVLCVDAVEVELFDHLALWLGSLEGLNFIIDAEAKLVVYQHKLRPEEVRAILATKGKKA